MKIDDSGLHCDIEPIISDCITFGFLVTFWVRIPVKTMFFVIIKISKCTLKKKLTHFATKSSEIIISSWKAGSTLQKRSLLYETQKKYIFLISLMMLNVVIQGLYDIQITPNKFCIARMYWKHCFKN
jgi:hypothetical protein